MADTEYDGFYFLPDEESDGIRLSFFTFNKKAFKGKPIGGTEIGDMFHIAFFRKNEDGLPEYDDDFEAIFADPVVYIESLVGSNLFGCILRKTEKSGKWWKIFLTDTKKNCTMFQNDDSLDD